MNLLSGYVGLICTIAFTCSMIYLIQRVCQVNVRFNPKYDTRPGQCIEDVILRNITLWAVTESEAIEKGLTKEYYKRVKKEITDTNEAIKRGVMKGANVKRIPDFQASQENK